jgi:hypothetical protein
VVDSLLDLHSQYIESKVDMCMPAVLVVDSLLDLHPGSIEVAQRREWLVMRLLLLLQLLSLL